MTVRPAAREEVRRGLRRWLHDDEELIANIDLDAATETFLREVGPVSADALNMDEFRDRVHRILERHDRRESP